MGNSLRQFVAGASDPDAVDSGRFTVHPHGFAGSRLFRRSQGFSEISVHHGSVYFAGAQCRIGPDTEGWPDGLRLYPEHDRGRPGRSDKKYRTIDL